ncbi:hypothetical protein [Actinomyces trachealis]|uniref:hypothetical protein n=1 Tax=Actinomyces trachealis TaxID=2763540 RepID=UPI001F28F88D|nr:hypothetical protein [Actinomyces trachealis]
MPASATPFVEALDDADLNLCARQVTKFGRLAGLRGEAGKRAVAHLAEQSYALACKHKALTVQMLDALVGLRGCRDRRREEELVERFGHQGRPCGGERGPEPPGF